MRRRLLWVGMVVVVLLATAACGGRADPTRGAASRSTSTTRVPDTRVVPRHITVAYVNAVFVKLNHVYGNAVRAAVKAKAVTPAVLADLHAIYKQPEYGRKIVLFKVSLRTELHELRNPPGNQITTVRKLLSASASCIFVETVTNFKAVMIRESKPAPSEYEKLVRRTRADSDGMNPTPWAVSLDAVFAKPTVLDNQCT